MTRLKTTLLATIMLCGFQNFAQDSLSKKLDEFTIRAHNSTTQISTLSTIKTENIGGRELLKAACCNLSESFETTPSVDVGYTDAVSGYKQIQMLGLASAYTAFTRENIPDIRGLASITGFTFTPGTWIESMQLSKGTGSVVNGYEGVAGQINVEWRKPFEDKEPAALLNLYQNTQGRTEANAVLNKKFSDALSSNLFVNAKSQWMQVDMNNDGYMDQPLDKQLVAANRWFWFSPKNWEVQAGVKGTYLDNRGGMLDKVGYDIFRPLPWQYKLNLKRLEGWAKIGHVFSKPATSVGLQLSALHHEQNALYGRRNYDALQQSFYANLIYQTIIGNTNHVIKGGASALIDNYDETFAGQRFQRNETVPGVFTEYSFTGGTKWNIVAGLRADYHNLFGAFVTPRLHVRYVPWDRAALRASVGRSQRTANIFAENIGYMASSRNFIIETPESGLAYGLNPEVAWNYGVNFTQKFRLNYRDGVFTTDYYFTNFQNQIVVNVEQFDKVRFSNLAGTSYAHSFQAQLDYELIRKLDFRLAYRFYDVRTSYDNVLKQKPLIAPHRAFMNVGYETKSSWQFDYTLQWISSKRVPQIMPEANTILPSRQSPSYFLMNAQITKSFKNGAFDLYVGGENLTNYLQPNAVIQPNNPFSPGFDASMIWGPVMGRNVYAGLRWKL